MASYITTHNSSGEAIFSSKITSPAPQLAYKPGKPEEGAMQIIYDSDVLRPDLSHETDIDTYITRRNVGYPPGTISPENGTALVIVTMGAGAVSPLHRTMTLDTILVLEGVVELHLDSGEMKTIKAGDTIVQRATMHQWRNVTPEGGMVRIVVCVQPIAGAVKVGGRKLEGEWKG